MTPETAAVLAWARDAGVCLSAYLIEVGCGDGVTESNSAPLIEAGWWASLFDADPAAVALARHRWCHTPRVEVVQAAVAGRSGSDVLCRRADFTVSHLKSVTGVPARTVEEMPVTTRTLSALVGPAPRIGLLGIDAEGADTDILAEFLATAGHDDARPQAIICESNTERERERQDAIARAYGYRRLAVIRPNGVYVREGACR